MSTFGLLLAAALHAPEWIVAGMWTTPGALSLDGLSSERDLRPNAGIAIPILTLIRYMRQIGRLAHGKISVAM